MTQNKTNTGQIARQRTAKALLGAALVLGLAACATPPPAQQGTHNAQGPQVARDGEHIPHRKQSLQPHHGRRV